MGFFKKLRKGFKKATKFVGKSAKKAAKFSVKNVGKVAKFAAPVISTFAPLAGPLVSGVMTKLQKLPVVEKIGNSNFLKMAEKTIKTGATLRNKIRDTLPRYGMEASPVNVMQVETGLKRVQRAAIGRALPVDTKSTTNFQHTENKTNQIINSQKTSMKEKLTQAYEWAKDHVAIVVGAIATIGIAAYLIIKRK